MRGVLSQFARPQTLLCPSGEVATLFGEGAAHYFAHAAGGAALIFAGADDRPLCKCTDAHTACEVLMYVAPMAPFLQCSADRRAHACRTCMAEA